MLRRVHAPDHTKTKEQYAAKNGIAGAGGLVSRMMKTMHHEVHGWQEGSETKGSEAGVRVMRGGAGRAGGRTSGRSSAGVEEAEKGMLAGGARALGHSIEELPAAWVAAGKEGCFCFCITMHACGGGQRWTHARLGACATKWQVRGSCGCR